MLSFSNVRIGISIHAPRGGSDNRRPKYPAEPQDFNPRSPWGERLQDGWLVCPICNRFQSTLPVGGATGPNSIHDLLKNISIHAPRGGSDPVHLLHRLRLRISIHAPRGGSDVGSRRGSLQALNFNPRSPWGERQTMAPYVAFNVAISIHAPRGGSDNIIKEKPDTWKIFQSTLPVGGATIMPILFRRPMEFQSTLPVGGATRSGRKHSGSLTISIHAPRGGSDYLLAFTLCDLSVISIHAPRGGSDPRSMIWRTKAPGFQSTLPVGGATPDDGGGQPMAEFQSTLPVGGATRLAFQTQRFLERFQSTLPVGGATERFFTLIFALPDFNPRSPWGERP